jgi:hypothetical protein
LNDIAGGISSSPIIASTNQRDEKEDGLDIA